MSQLTHILRSATWTEEGCLIPNCYHNADGYGQVHIERRTRLAHRYVFEQVLGRIPDGMCVCHTCDNPACINPLHLFLGSHADNAADRNRKGRQARGERNGRAVLSERAVRNIREQAGAVPISELATRYNVSPRNIRKIVNGETWNLGG